MNRDAGLKPRATHSQGRQEKKGQKRPVAELASHERRISAA